MMKKILYLSLFCFLQVSCMSNKQSLVSWKDNFIYFSKKNNNNLSDTLYKIADMQSINLARSGRISFGGILKDNHYLYSNQYAKGDFLGIVDQNGAQWYLFIVGSGNREKIKDIRLVAFSKKNDTILTKESRKNSAALKLYFKNNSNLNRFPNNADNFIKKQTGKTVIVTDKHSKAQWEIIL